MKRRFLAVLVTGALAACAPGLAAADPGNEATGSVGTVQVGATSVDPTAGTVTDTVGAAVAAPTTIGDSAGNTADASAGTAQVGGGNSADRAAGSAQVSSTSSEPRAMAQAAGAKVVAAAPVSTAGGTNRAERSVGTVQVGGGNRASDSAVTVQVGTTGAGASASVSRSGRAVQAGAARVDVAAGDGGGRRGVRPRSVVLRSDAALPQIESLSLDLDVAITFDSLALLVGGVAVEVTPNGGNAADGSFATAGGGNEASGSIGTIQIGAVNVSPAARIATPVGTLELGGSTGSEARAATPAPTRSARCRSAAATTPTARPAACSPGLLSLLRP